MKKLEISTTPSAHPSDLKVNAVEDNTVEVTQVKGKPRISEKLERLMKEELRTVRGIFQNFETPGLSLRLQVKKYPGHQFDNVLEDGKEYEVPLYIARHLNGIDAMCSANNGNLGTCSYPVHAYIMDKDGNPMINSEKRRRRYGFQSVEFSSTNLAPPVSKVA